MPDEDPVVETEAEKKAAKKRKKKEREKAAKKRKAEGVQKAAKRKREEQQTTEEAAGGEEEEPQKKKKIKIKKPKAGVFVPPVDTETGEHQGSERKITTIYVTNLPFTATEVAIADFFNSSGATKKGKEKAKGAGVQAVRIPRNKDGKSRGICFVDFGSKSAATQAVKLNGLALKGRELGVVISEKGNAATAESQQGPGDQPEGCFTIFLKNLPYDFDPKELRKTLGEGIKEIRPFRDQETGDGKGMAYVELQDEETAAEAMKLNGSLFQKRPMKMDWTANKDDAMKAKWENADE